MRNSLLAKLILVSAALTAISACAVRPESLAQYGNVKLDGHLLNSLTIERAGISKLGGLPLCIAQNVSNESITVSDSAGSFVGAYTGNYYQTHNSTTVGGGSVIQYVSPDSMQVVAAGTTRYWAAMIERAVRYKVSVADSGSARTYTFTNVEVAQINSGTWPNSGFFRAAMNPGAGGGHALKNMQAVADSIESCLKG